MKKIKKEKNIKKTIYTISILGIVSILLCAIVPISYSITNTELFTMPDYQTTIVPKIVIGNQPPSSLNQNVSIGLDAKFSVSASVENPIKDESINYQWYSNNKPMENGTSPSITIPTLNFTVGSSIKYYCELNYKNAKMVTSSTFTLNITAKPVIDKLGIMENQSVPIGSIATFELLEPNVINQINGETLKYQWYTTDTTDFNGSPIQGKTGRTLDIDTTSFNEKNNYYYYCTVSYKNAISVNSNIVKLNVTPTPAIKIINYPSNQNIAPGNPVSFLIGAEIINSNTLSPNDFKYQWYYSTTNSNNNGEMMVGETSTTLTIGDTAGFIGSTRWYYCIISHTNLPPVTSNVVSLSTASSFNKESATFALNLWLSNKANQKKVLQTYFSNSTNVMSMFASEHSIKNYWIEYLDSSFESAQEVPANAIPNINFDTWKINLKLGPQGGNYRNSKPGGGWDMSRLLTIKANSTISFYLPFSLIQDVSLIPVNIVFQNTRNLNFIHNNRNATAISWTSITTTPEIFNFTVKEPGATTFVMNTQLLNFSYPTFTSENANLPIYKPYELTK